MPNNYTTIIAKLKAMLAALDDGSGPSAPKIFGEVFDYPDADFTKYPAACVYERTGSGQVMDTAHNEREFVFRIMMYQEQSKAGKTKSEAAANMRACVDAVIKMFDQNVNLDGVVMRVKVIPVTFDFTSRTGTFNFATIDLVATDFVQTYQ